MANKKFAHLDQGGKVKTEFADVARVNFDGRVVMLFCGAYDADHFQACVHLAPGESLVRVEEGQHSTGHKCDARGHFLPDPQCGECNRRMETNGR